MSYDRVDYRERNVIERSFVHLKQSRGLATRYDKLAIVFRAGAVLNAVLAWTRHLRDVLYVGTNSRYSEQLQHAGLDWMESRPPGPVELPQQACGPRPIAWTGGRTPVWVWAQFPDRPAERLPGYVKGSNDRVVVV